MRYVAKKVKKQYFVTGIKDMETLDGNMIEVKFANKMYDKKVLEETIKKYEEEKNTMLETYEINTKDMKDILEAINNAEQGK